MSHQQPRTDKAWAPGDPEHRVQVRLRALVDDLKAGVERNRRDMEMQNVRIERLQADIDELKRARVARMGRRKPRPALPQAHQAATVDVKGPAA